MPPNLRANIRRRLRQADAGFKRACVFLADVYVTVNVQHPDLGGELLAQMICVDNLRKEHLDVYRRNWGGTERGLWKPGELRIILNEARVITDPKSRH